MFQSMEYIFSDEMMELLDHFTSLTEVRIAFFSLSGEELYIGKNRKGSEYCTLRRQSILFDEACREDDQRGRDVALEQSDVHFYQCHAGLCEAVMPVRIVEVPIGFVMIGQFRLAGAHVDVQSGEDRIALDKLPVFTREKANDLLSMFQVLIHHISNQSMVSRRDHELLGPLVERIRKSPADPISLAEAAKFVGLSSSRLSHLFTSTMGISFKRYQISQRLELADRLMKANPSWRISRIAEACGFEDQFYFSRLYKKHRGVPPSKMSSGNTE